MSDLPTWGAVDRKMRVVLIGMTIASRESVAAKATTTETVSG